jgi:serine protease Do
MPGFRGVAPVGCLPSFIRPLFLVVLALSLATGAAARARPPSGDFADLAERLLPSVVNISTTQVIDAKKAAEEDMDEDVPLEEWFRDYFENRRRGGDDDGDRPHKRRQTSLGSGFIIDKAGYIVTNNHVIEDADKISVILQDDTVLEATIVGRDPKVDVALLKVTPKTDLKPLKWANSDKVRVGQWVLAIGNPFGLGGSVSVGIISARARDINAGQYDDFLQTDAAINRGNSGGPLLDENGDVVGINTAIYSITGGSAGVGFAASANLVRPVLDDLRKFGRARRGWLGVKIQTVTPEIAESLGLEQSAGALISQVDSDGPAAKAKLQTGDVVLTFDGKKIHKMRELPRLVAAAPVGRTVDIGYWRQGRAGAAKLKVGELKEEPVAALPAPEAGPQGPVARAELKSLGIGVSEINDRARDKYDIPDDVKGLVVLDVDDDSDAARNGLRRGDVIDEIQQKEIKTVADADAALAAATKDGHKTVLLRIVSGDDVHFIGVKVDNEP